MRPRNLLMSAGVAALMAGAATAQETTGDSDADQRVLTLGTAKETLKDQPQFDESGADKRTGYAMELDPA